MSQRGDRHRRPRGAVERLVRDIVNYIERALPREFRGSQSWGAPEIYFSATRDGGADVRDFL